MKFQNPSLNFFWTDGRTDARTHTRTSRNQYAPHFFKVGCIKSGNTVFQIITLSVAMETSGRIWPNFELIQVLCMSSLPARMKKTR